MSKEFEIARLLVVAAARRGECDYADGYAWAHRVFPQFDGSKLSEEFAADFDVTADEANAVFTFLDEKWRAKEPLDFYKIEDEFGTRGGGGHISRAHLVFLLRYAYLSGGRFDDDFWNVFPTLGTGPVESQGITNPQEPDWDLSL